MGTSASYDKDYQTPDLFGEAYKELVSFFSELPARGTVLDLGCGQGRDSIALAKLGYEVTGVDISAVGIEQMIGKAKGLGLKLNGQVADIYNFEYNGPYDIVILDSIIHFGKSEKESELQLLRNAAEHGDIICVCVRQSKIREQKLNDFFDSHKFKWETLNDTYVDYLYQDPYSNHSSRTTYNMLIKKRLKEHQKYNR